ncbi:unnamed protein product [Pleuronectes platessa]|uniref:Uncharacterized protein n=1 Tax=Pleuronectes platessa TaxID=8262 RepID=A0A9N7VCD4_PLEPL|nr:unnamed protein product [Pleuronectes platessa]
MDKPGKLHTLSPKGTGFARFSTIATSAYLCAVERLSVQLWSRVASGFVKLAPQHCCLSPRHMWAAGRLHSLRNQGHHPHPAPLSRETSSSDSGACADKGKAGGGRERRGRKCRCVHVAPYLSSHHTEQRVSDAVSVVVHPVRAAGHCTNWAIISMAAGATVHHPAAGHSFAAPSCLSHMPHSSITGFNEKHLYLQPPSHSSHSSPSALSSHTFTLALTLYASVAPLFGERRRLPLGRRALTARAGKPTDTLSLCGEPGSVQAALQETAVSCNSPSPPSVYPLPLHVLGSCLADFLRGTHTAADSHPMKSRIWPPTRAGGFTTVPHKPQGIARASSANSTYV